MSTSYNPKSICTSIDISLQNFRHAHPTANYTSLGCRRSSSNSIYTKLNSSSSRSTPSPHPFLFVLCFVNGTTCYHRPSQRPGSYPSLFAPPHPKSLTSTLYQELAIPSLESIHFSPLTATSLLQLKFFMFQLEHGFQLVLRLFHGALSGLFNMPI